MDTLTVRLPSELHQRLATRARRLNRKKSSYVRELIEQALNVRGQTCHDLMQAACGHYAGSIDSSLKEGLDECVRQ
jgi:predicted transcriptional regulator